MSPLSPSNALFSKVQQRVLSLLYGHPERSFYTSEILRQVRSGSGAVTRQLSRLQRSGLVSVDRIGNQKHYQANRQSPVFNELRSLIVKTSGLAQPIANALAPFADKIDAAFIYGSVAKGTDSVASDIDIIAIGDDLDHLPIYVALQKLENVLERRIDIKFLSMKNWRRKAADKSSFISRVAELPKIFILGTEEGLR